MTHQEQIDIAAARSAAGKGGLFFFEKAGQYLIYRLAKPRNVFVARAANPAELKRKVMKAATTVAARVLTTTTRSESHYANP